MKGILTLKKSTIIATICLAVLCLPGYSEPTPEQVKERTELLKQAIENNDAERAKLCIKLGADVNAMIYNEYYYQGRYVQDCYTLLSYAVARNDYKDIAELLIKAGADINVKTDYGETVLKYVASQEGWKDITELLIKAGADVNAKTNDNVRFIFGGTALMSAASSGQKDSAELLIKAGANPNATDTDGLTLLTHAILYGKNDIADLLRAAGAKE